MSRTNYKLFAFALPLVMLLGLFTASYVHAQNATCNVVDVQIRNNITVPNPTGDDDADGETNWQEEFMIDSNPPFVYFDIKTIGCLDANTTYDMELSLTEHDDGAPNPLMGYIPDFTDDDVNNISELDDFNIDVPSNDFTVAYLAGEDECEGTGDPDCDYHAEIWDGDSSAEQWSALNYSCDAACDEGWVFKGFLPYGANHAADQTGVIPPTTSPGVFSGMTTDYLAPLPGVGGTADLHGFLQSLFNVLIIIAGILAIIMIVIGAVTYVSTDSFSGTEHGREVMMNAVLGLILALGAWVILNTINPNLASNLSITIPQVRYNPKFEPEDSVGAGVNSITVNVLGGGTQTITNCDESQMVSIDAFGKTFKIHQGLADSIADISQQWQLNGGNDWYKIDTVYGYNCRKVRGTSSWSAHAFGMAVDINPERNPFGSTLITDMVDLPNPPPSFVQLFLSEGWGWGGNWSSKKDAMHFSKYPPSEGGNATIGND